MKTKLKFDCISVCPRVAEDGSNIICVVLSFNGIVEMLSMKTLEKETFFFEWGGFTGEIELEEECLH